MLKAEINDHYKQVETRKILNKMNNFLNHSFIHLECFGWIGSGKLVNFSI